MRTSTLPKPAIALLGAAAVFALGCSVESVEFTADADTGSTHALVSVERSTLVNADEAPRAEALAGFVRVPAVVDPGSVLDLVGLGLELPPPGQCAASTPSREGSRSLSPLGYVEFLDAGDVALAAAGSSAISLAPRAFPTVTDLVSGVVYTTRDRSADPLPAGESYELRTSGALSVPAMFVAAQAPAEIVGVSVGGVPLGEVETVAAAKVLDIAWTAGEGGDLVYVELATEGGNTTCVFRDDAGAGSVPAGAFNRTGEGRLSLHRLRIRDFFRPPAIDRGELRFDFELVAPVRYSE